MSRNRKLFWLALSIVAAVIAVTSFGGLPSASDLVSGADSKKQQAAALNSKSAQALEASNNPAEFANELASARAAVPPVPELAQLISQVQTQAQAAGVTWTSGSPRRSMSGDTPSWGMEMVVTGSVQQVVDLINRLRSLPRLIVVESVALQQSGDELPQATLSISFFATQGELQSFPEEQREAIEKEWSTEDNGGSDAFS